MSIDARASGRELLRLHVNNLLSRPYRSSHYNVNVFNAIKRISTLTNKKLICFEFGASGGELGAQLVASGVANSYLGCEINDVAVVHAKSKGICLIKNSAEGVIKSKSKLISTFNTFVYADVLEHLVDPWEHLCQLSKRINPGSYIVVSIPCFFHHSNLSNLGSYDFRYEEWGVMDLTHLRHFGIRNMLEMLELAGFAEMAAIKPVPAFDPQGLNLYNSNKDRLPVEIKLGNLGINVHSHDQLLQICSYQFIICAVKK